MKKKVLLIVLFVVSSIQIGYSQMSAHQRMANQANRSTQSMNRMFDAMNKNAANTKSTEKDFSLSIIEKLQKESQKELKKKEKYQKQLVSNNKILKSNTNWSTNQKGKLEDKSKKIEQKLNESKALIIAYQKKIEEETKKIEELEEK